MMKTLLLILFFISFTGYAVPKGKSTDNQKTETQKKKDSADVAKNNNNTTATGKPDTDNPSKGKRALTPITEDTIKTICIMFFVVMLVLIMFFFIQAYLKGMYLGFQSIKFIGLVIMFPGICIIALVGGDLISDSTLAALLGTIAGYVLSKEDDKGEGTASAALKREKEKLAIVFKEIDGKLTKEAIKELKAKIKME